MTAVTGTGRWPGDGDLLTAQLTVFEATAALPSTVAPHPPMLWLPARGPYASPIGRACAMLADLPVEQGPHGWKLADRPSRDEQRARTTLRDDVAALAIAASGYSSPLMVTAVGPWTMATTLYKARGDLVLSDLGAVRDLAASLAVGLADHLMDVARQIPGAQLTVRIEEPAIPDVLAGAVATFSGYSRIAAVPAPVVIETAQPVLDAVRSTGARSILGASVPGIAYAALAGADGVCVRVGTWDERSWELIARAVERGMTPWFAIELDERCSIEAAADQVSVPWGRIGLPRSGLADVGILAADPATDADSARSVWRVVGQVAETLAERAAG